MRSRGWQPQYGPTRHSDGCSIGKGAKVMRYPMAASSVSWWGLFRVIVGRDRAGTRLSGDTLVGMSSGVLVGADRRRPMSEGRR